MRINIHVQKVRYDIENEVAVSNMYDIILTQIINEDCTFNSDKMNSLFVLIYRQKFSESIIRTITENKTIIKMYVLH